MCLKKVMNDDIQNYEDLPTVLVRTINLMKMFNGSYVICCPGEYQHTLSIDYDGDNWNFKSFVYFAEKCYCISCRDPEDILEAKIREGQIITNESQIEDFVYEVLSNPYKCDMKFKVVEKSGGTSALVFQAVGMGGSSGTVLCSLTRNSHGDLVIHATEEYGKVSKDVFLQSDGVSVEDEVAVTDESGKVIKDVFLQSNVSVEDEVAVTYEYGKISESVYLQSYVSVEDDVAAIYASSVSCAYASYWIDVDYYDSEDHYEDEED